MATETDTLVKPDMVAILERTHVSKDLHGFLLPLLEAVSNAMHGIEARFPESAAVDGKVEITISNLNDPERIMISVTDNGVGLDNQNYQWFKTPFSGHKLKQNGRGFGRFIGFKVFNRILYSSRYDAFPSPERRTFQQSAREEKGWRGHVRRTSFIIPVRPSKLGGRQMMRTTVPARASSLTEMYGRRNVLPFERCSLPPGRKVRAGPLSNK